MSYLEELLPEFRKGAKIRSSMWSKKAFIHLKDGKILDETGLPYIIPAIVFHINDWELYQEPIDWGYIIKNKCLCWFWDDCYEEHKSGGILTCCENGKYWQEGEDTAWDNCRPVRKDEVTFYEDKNNE